MPRTLRTAPGPDTVWEVPDALWDILDDALRDFYPPAATGRPRADFRRVLNGIIYRLRSGVQWNRLPAEFGPDSTVHRWFQRFVADGVFEQLWAVLVGACDELGGVEWRWQSADTVLSKARSGGASSGETRRTGASRAASGAC